MSFDLFFPERFPPFLSSGPTEGFTKAMIVFPFPAQIQGCAWKSTAVNPPKSGELKDTMSTSLWVTEIPLHHSPAVAERWFPAGAVLPARGHWTTPGDIFGCHNWPLERSGRDVIKQHTMHRTAPQQWILRTTNWNISTTNNWETVSERSPNLSWPFEEVSTKALEKLNKTKAGTNLLS